MRVCTSNCNMNISSREWQLGCTYDAAEALLTDAYGSDAWELYNLFLTQPDQAFTARTAAKKLIGDVTVAAGHVTSDGEHTVVDRSDTIEAREDELIKDVKTLVDAGLLTSKPIETEGGTQIFYRFTPVTIPAHVP